MTYLFKLIALAAFVRESTEQLLPIPHLDLTTRRGIRETENNGIDLSLPPYQVFMKVPADRALLDLGYTWIVDGNECGSFLHSRKTEPFFDA